MANVFSREYDKGSIKSYPVAGFNFSITPRFKSHYIDSPDPYEWLTVKIFNAYIAPGSTVLDIGAHYGYYTLNAAREVGKNGKVISLEPVTFNFDVLKRNIKDNGFSAIIDARQNPASNVIKRVSFNITEASDNGGFYDHPNTRILETVNKQSTTIDSILNDQDNVSVIKIDAEGHECEILEASREVIVRNKPVFFIEFNPKCLLRAGHEPEDLLRSASTLGYKIVFIDDKNGSLIPCSNPRKWRKFIAEQGYMNFIALPKKKFSDLLKGGPSIFGVKLEKY